MKWKFLPLLAALTLASTFAQDAPPSLEELKEELKKNPKDETALYNAGLATYLTGDFKESVGYFERLKKVTPTDWKARAKLVQAYEGAAMMKQRDAEIAEIRKARESGKHADLMEQEFFMRDQFEVAGVRAFVLEYFELKGDRPLVWKFILKKGEEYHDFYVSLGSYDLTTETMRALGEIAKDERGYHLDGYGKDGSHRTYGIFKKNPGYDETKKMVVKILKDELKAQSATLPGKGEEKEDK